MVAHRVPAYPAAVTSHATVVIADDHEMVRYGYRMLLDAQPDLRVVAEAADGGTALAHVRRLRPDVLLADVRMPVRDGLELTRLITADPALPTSVIVITTFHDDDYVAEALRAGAGGFLLKSSAPGLLPSAIRAALEGNTLVSPEVTLRLLQRLPAANRTGARQPATPLTRRERDVVCLLARGLSNDEIAAELSVSPGTVKTHVANVSTKLGGANRVGVAVWAWESGLVSRW